MENVSGGLKEIEILMGGGNLEFLRVLLGHYDYTVTKGYSSLAAQYQMLGVPVYKPDPIFFRMPS